MSEELLRAEVAERELATVRAELDTFCRVLADNECYCLEMAELRDAAIERAEVAEALVGAFREAVGVDPTCPKCHGDGGRWLGLASSCEHWEPCQCWRLSRELGAAEVIAAGYPERAVGWVPEGMVGVAGAYEERAKREEAGVENSSV